MKKIKLWLLIWLMNDYQMQVGKWAKKTFPQATTESILLHLKKEVRELQFGSANESSDIVLLLMHFGYLYNMSIIRETILKFNLNQKIVWGKLNSDGTVSHEENQHNKELYRKYNENLVKKLYRD